MSILSISGSPNHEHQRSPAARTIAAMAHGSDLFLSHFEHRLAMPLPPSWTDGQGHVPSRFVGGVLEEPKYQAFRHDLLVASFHPGHRAKWTAHELCHALVGFAYHPEASLLFHSLAAWLAELMPVALWYFFDEAGARRCADHQYGGPVFQRHCEACEQAAQEGARRITPADRKHVAEGRAFVDRELAAIARSRRLGRPRGTLHASIDLASDGLAYAHAHGPRLRAPEMERFVTQFFAVDQGHHQSLDALEERVLQVCAALCGGSPAPAFHATRWDYTAQDVGYRLLALRATATHHAAELDRSIDALAKLRTRAGVARCIRTYMKLWASESPRGRKGLLAPELLFAVGYALPEAQGHAVQQLAEGVASACPNAWQALGSKRAGLASRFAEDDRPERTPIGRRFAGWLLRTQPGPVADLAALEAAITHVRPRDPLAVQLDPREAADDRVRFSSGVEVVRLSHDVASMSAAEARKAKRLPEPRVLLVARAGEQDVDLIELPEQVAQRLEAADEKGTPRQSLGLTDETVNELLDARWLMPVRYRG